MHIPDPVLFWRIIRYENSNFWKSNIQNIQLYSNWKIHYTIWDQKLYIYQSKTTGINTWRDDIHISQRFNKKGPITIYDMHNWCEHGKLMFSLHPTN